MTEGSFRFGPPDLGQDAHGGCCGKPAGCTIASRGCLHKVEKKAWQASARTEGTARAEIEAAVTSAVAASQSRTALTRGELSFISAAVYQWHKRQSEAS